MVSLVAWGGVGKSTLVRKWVEELAEDNWRGAERVLGWSFFSQGTGERATSADQFVGQALRFFNDPDPLKARPGPGRAAGRAGPQEQSAPDPGWPGAASGSPIRGSRIRPRTPDRGARAGQHGPLRRLDPGNSERACGFPDFRTAYDLEQTSPEAGRALLRVKGVRGTDAELDQASEAFGNHALAIKLLANWLRAIPGHPIAGAWDRGPGHSARGRPSSAPSDGSVCSAVRRGQRGSRSLAGAGPVRSAGDEGGNRAVRKPPPIPGLTERLGPGRSRLARLLERLREGLGRAGEQPCAGRGGRTSAGAGAFRGGAAGETCRGLAAGHAQLYEYFKALPEKHQPDTLEEMAPLFQAVFHGCQAGRHQEALDEVYWARIVRELKPTWSKSWARSARI